MAEHTIGIIVGLVIIVGGLLTIFGFASLPDLWDNVSDKKNLPFEIKLSPEYFDEGNYDNYYKIPFSIEINKKTRSNITYIELSEENFKVSRKDEDLNKPTSRVNWKSSRSDKIISFGNLNPSYTSYPFSKTKAEGEMSLCQNCFIGTEYPYLFTFTIYYKEGSGELKSETFNEIIPIK